MNCFQHQSVTSVGACKHCGKGLCAECAVDLGHGLACRGHEQEAENLCAMVATARATQSTNTRYKYLSPAFFFVFGSLFLAFGLLNLGRASSLMLVLGSAFLASSLVLVFVVRGASSKSSA